MKRLTFTKYNFYGMKSNFFLHFSPTPDFERVDSVNELHQKNAQYVS
jgi:hypothetical protein